jgi:hypothetical protein
MDFNLAGTVISAEAKLNADADNQLEMTATGIKGNPQDITWDSSARNLTITDGSTVNITDTNTTYTVSDTSSMNFSLTGTAISAEAKLNADADNQLEITATGIKSNPQNLSFNSSSGDLTLTDGGTVNLPWPDPPTTNGTYSLQVTSSGLAWV